MVGNLQHTITVTFSVEHTLNGVLCTTLYARAMSVCYSFFCVGHILYHRRPMHGWVLSDMHTSDLGLCLVG